MKVAIFGAGITGLATAHFLHRRGIDVEVFEASSSTGGAAASFLWNGHVCDWAAHRLFTRDDHILQLVQSLSPLRTLDRVSAVRLGGKWLRDPVDAVQLCCRFFPHNTFSVPFSYLSRPKDLPETSFESYCIAHYGARLERTLFSPYTEKMFGIPASKISVEWARKKTRLSGPLDVIRQGSKTKFNYFYYPLKGGFGSICDALLKPVESFVHLNARLEKLELSGDRVSRAFVTVDGQPRTVEADVFVSTLPLSDICALTGFSFPLDYRSVAALYVLLSKPHASKNHWIYFMDGPSVLPNRVCEVKNMCPDSGPEDSTVLCTEITECHAPGFQDTAIRQLSEAGLFSMDEVRDSTVVTRSHAYPVYSCGYEADVDKARAHLARFSNLRSIGRAAQFEHMEIDNCLEAALHCVRELSASPSVSVADVRSDLPVEPRVSVVVADSSTPENLDRCLASFAAVEYSQLSLSVATSSPEAADRIAKQHPNVLPLLETSSSHVAALFNKGIARAILKDAADFVLLVPSNTTADPQLLQRLVRVAQRDPDAGILTPKVCFADRPDTLFSIGLRFRSFPPSTKNIGAGMPAAAFPKSIEVDFAAANGLLVSRSALEKAGLFDPGFSCFYEDIDFSKRVRDAGFRIRLVPDATLFISPSSEVPSPAFFEAWGESFTRFYRRHRSPASLPVHAAYLLARELLSPRCLRVPALARGIFRGLGKSIGAPPALDNADLVE